MRLRNIFILLMPLFIFSCVKVPVAITNVEWNYDLIVNGVKAGKAVISNREEEGLLVSKTEMFVSMGTIKSSTKQVVTEGKDFRPVRLEIINTIEDSSTGSRQVINKTAEFTGNTVTLKSDGTAAKYTITEPFILDGNYFTDQLIKSKFREGMEVRARLYEPTVSADSTILVIVSVTGREKTLVSGRESELIHIKQRVEKLKSVDIYINDTGVIEKVAIKMLNNIFVMERTD